MRILLAAAACLWAGERLAAQGDTTRNALPMHVHSSASLQMPPASTGSGTSWLPDSSPMRMLGRNYGSWSVLVHGAAFLSFNNQRTKRGETQLGLTDWEMVMAVRNVKRARLQLRLMTSIEPLTLRGNGYPLLLQTGGTYRHAFMHDRQHPHASVVELAAFLEQPIAGPVTASMYAGAVGEPAVGPAAYMHRPSAQNDPFAPLGHHWQDASHQTFGVVTLGLGTQRLRLEASAFNSREADEHHLFMDYRGARLDSYAGRLSVAANRHVVASTWWAFLSSHGRLDPSARMHRYGASLMVDASGAGSGRWTSTFVWGMNLHHHNGGSHLILHGNPGASPHHHAASLLAESNFELGKRTALFARVERVKKNGEELGFLGGDLTALYDVRSMVLGATREVLSVGNAQFAVGARGALNFVPQSLFATYGTRRPTGFAVYTRVRPKLHIMR